MSFLCASASLAALNAARAQEAAPDSSLVELDPISVTATKTQSTAGKSLSGTSVIGGEPMHTVLSPNNLSKVLQQVPGVETAETGQDPGVAINIRGLQDFGRVAVLIDGARQNYAVMGHGPTGSFYFDPEMLSSVDITRGPVANIYGSGAIGGVAAFNTIGPADVIADGDSWGARLRGSYTTNGAGITTHGEFASHLGDDVDALLAGTWRKDNKYEDGASDEQPHTGQKLLSGLAKGAWRPAPGHELTASAMAYDNDFDANATTDDPTSTLRDTTVKAETYTAGYTFSRPDIWWADASLKAYYTRTRSEQKNKTGTTAGYGRDFKVETVGVDASNTMRFDTGPVSHALTYGGDWFNDHVASDADSTLDNGTLFNPSGHRNVYGGFIQNQARWRWFELTAGVRFDAYDMKGQAADSDGSHVSPKVTAGVTPVEGLTLYATYAEGYRSPSLTETLISGTHPPPANFLNFRPNPNLKPEIAHNKEAGINLNYDNLILPGDKLRVKADYFDNRVHDYIDLGLMGMSFYPAFAIDYQYVNVARARLRGVELDANYDGGWIFAGVVAQKMKGRNLTDHTDLVSVPADRVTATLGLRSFERRLTWGGRGDFVSAQKDVPEGTVRSGDYTLWDLFASYKVTDRISTGVYLDNITDKQYTPYLDQIPRPGFSAKFVLDIAFGG